MHPPSTPAKSFASARTRRTVLWSIGFGVLALAAAAVLLARSSTMREARLEERVAARITLASAGVGVEGSDVAAGQELADGATLRSGKGTACFRMAPGARACLLRGGELRVEEAFSAHGRVALVRGKLAVAFDSRAPGGSFTVSLSSDDVTAVGTKFTVEVDAPNRHPTVRVLQGKVSVAAQTRPVIVAAGEVLEASGARRAIGDQEKAGELQGLALTDACDTDAPATLEVTSAAAVNAVHVDRMDFGPAPLTALIAPGDHLVSAEGSQSEWVTARPGVKSSIVLRVQSPSGAREAASVSGSLTEGVPTAFELLQQARVLRTGGRLAESAEAYRTLLGAWPRSAEAREAIVSLGEVLLSLGDGAGALRMFDAYMGSGGGGLAEQARYGKILALRSLGRGPEERQAIEQFLAEYPSDLQARALRSRLADLGASLR